MRKRGISPLIATILLIGIIVIVTLIVLNWTSKVAEQQIEDVTLQTSTLTYGIDFEAECLTDVTGTKILLENKVNKPIQYLVFNFDEGVVLDETNLGPYEIVNIFFPEHAKNSEVKITPRVELGDRVVNLHVSAEEIGCSVYLIVEGELPLITLGCTDESACNYNPNANIEEGNCYFDYCPGDLNNDGILNCEDLRKIIDYLWGEGLNSEQLIAADLNGDGEINIADVDTFMSLVSEESLADCTGCDDETSCNYDPEVIIPDESCDYSTQTYYLDFDGDGYGDFSNTVESCEWPECIGPEGSYPCYANVAEDCNDEEETINPSSIESCSDDLDNDCDGNIDCEDSDCPAPDGAEFSEYCILHEIHCNDGEDNDGEGGVDICDSDCSCPDGTKFGCGCYDFYVDNLDTTEEHEGCIGDQFVFSATHVGGVNYCGGMRFYPEGSGSYSSGCGSHYYSYDTVGTKYAKWKSGSVSRTVSVTILPSGYVGDEFSCP